MAQLGLGGASRRSRGDVNEGSALGVRHRSLRVSGGETGAVLLSSRSGGRNRGSSSGNSGGSYSGGGSRGGGSRESAGSHPRDSG